MQGQKVVAIVGVLADKDYEMMFRPMLSLVDEFFCITPPCPRALQGEKLAEYLETLGVKASACDTLGNTIQKAIATAGQEGAVLCFGSLYSIGEIQKALSYLL